ncbi:MAG: dienelactone hydrolase family protein [Planctomycetes bacterium]|nr:dienelactone hydrolase family protein [Planctomycetota bacterium]
MNYPILMLSIVGLAGAAALAGLQQNPAPAAKGGGLDAAAKKKIETLAEDWFKARPASAFEDWDDKAREKLLERAKAIELPEGARKDVIQILWKAARKHGDRLDATKPWISSFGKASYSVANAPTADAPKMGLLVGLHGGGEGAGDKSEAQGTWSPALSKHKLIGVFPQGIHLVHDTWNTIEGERFILNIIEAAKRTYDIDPDRVFFAGFSMGGTGSWFMAGRHPYLTAGAMPFHGVFFANPSSIDPHPTQIHHGFVPNVRHVPLYYTTGSVDDHCPPYTYLFAEKLLNDLRKKHPGDYEINFRCVEGLAHAFPPGEPQAGMQWILDRKRKTFPKGLTWENARDITFVATGNRIMVHSFYWLGCENPSDAMQVEAEIKGQNVSLEIKRHELKGFTVYLSSELIDVTKEVTLTVNGEEKFKGVLPPSFSAVLESMSDRYDRNMVFDRRIDF